MKRISILLIGAVGLWLVACTNLPQSTVKPIALATAAVQPDNTVLYEVVAEGDPTVGSGRQPIAFAWRPRSGLAVPVDLPDEAQAVLNRLESQGGSELYLVIYGGIQSSNQYAIKLTAVTLREGKLQVAYQVEGPPPGQGAATVMTHPYVIAKVNVPALQPSDVNFTVPTR